MFPKPDIFKNTSDISVISYTEYELHIYPSLAFYLRTDVCLSLLNYKCLWCCIFQDELKTETRKKNILILVLNYLNEEGWVLLTCFERWCITDENNLLSNNNKTWTAKSFSFSCLQFCSILVKKVVWYQNILK